MTVDRPCPHAMHLLVAAVLFATPLAAERPEPSPAASFAERQASWEQHLELDRTSLFRRLEWRNVGPVVQGGRVVDIESVPREPYTFYVAYASGGLWRTTTNGVSFEPLFDDQPTIIMGDVEIDPSNPETIWVGTGENNSSRSSYGGHGVSSAPTTAVPTWRHMGLGDSDRIGRIRVDPEDSNRVYVASLGKLYTPGGERGVSTAPPTEGRPGKKVLSGDETTGFTDLVFEPGNSRVLYAAAWERSRRPWNFVEGGEGSGLWKSSDGGDTWTRLDGGFPRGDHLGRIGLAVSASPAENDLRLARQPGAAA